MKKIAIVQICGGNGGPLYGLDERNNVYYWSNGEIQGWVLMVDKLNEIK